MMHKHAKAKTWFVTSILGASMIVPAGAARTARADDVSERAAADMDRLYNRQLAQIRDSNMSDADKITAINRLMAERNAAMRTSGMAGRLNQVGEATRTGNNTPGFWDKAGTAAIGIIGELLKAAITNWMNNPTKENEARIAMLEAERDRLMNERNNPTTGENGTGTNGAGRPVYDSSGNIIGWDRDGDGRVDSTDSNNDGRSDGFNGGTNENGYADPYEYLDGGRTGTTGGTPEDTRKPIYDSNGRFVGYDTNNDGRADTDLAANTPAGDVAASSPSVGGGGVGGGDSSGGDDEDKEDEDKEDEDKEKDDEELAAADAKDGVKTGSTTGKTADGKRDRNGDGKDDELQMETVMARIVVVPKVDPLAATGTGTAVGSARPGAAVAPAKPLEDNWNDTADNGDRSKAPDEWGDEWGEDWGGDGWSTTGGKPKPNANGAATGTGTTGTPTMTGAKPEDAQLVDELIRVETIVAEWRKVAREEAEGKRDPYGFHDGAGYQGSDGMTQDPLAEFRGPDGKLDLTRVDVWLVERDSWKEGMEPRRYKVTVSEEAIDTFEPIYGGYMMARGVISEMKVDPRVLAEIKGSVKKFDLVQVVLSSETPPEDPANAPSPPGAVPAPSTAPSGPAPSAGGDEDW